MKFERTDIPDIILCKPTLYNDGRGYFYEAFRKDKFEEFLKSEIIFCQDNEAKSSKGVVRGLHYQLAPHGQAKLVRVAEGRILDVAVDIRTESPTYGKHVAIELSDVNKFQLFIPEGFAHGYIALTDEVVVNYKVDAYYKPEADRGIFYNDPKLAIDWKMPLEKHIVSEKDRIQPTLEMVQLNNLKSNQ